LNNSETKLRYSKESRTVLFSTINTCAIFVGWVKRQRNPTDLLGFMLLLRNAHANNPTYESRLFQFCEGINNWEYFLVKIDRDYGKMAMSDIKTQSNKYLTKID
jgi:hypothetical protein